MSGILGVLLRCQFILIVLHFDLILFRIPLLAGSSRVSRKDSAFCRATVSFSAEFNYSGNGIQVSDGGSYENPTGASGTIRSYSAAIAGGSKGSVTFEINER